MAVVMGFEYDSEAETVAKTVATAHASSLESAGAASRKPK